MATYYSDLFDGATNTVLDPQKRVNAGIGHGRLRYKRAEATGSVQNGDVLRLMQFHSSDRLHAVYMTHSAAGIGSIINLGLYRSGRSHDGSEVDATLLLEGHDAKPAHAHLGHWEIPARLHGKHLWEIADAGTASYGADPDEEWDLCMNCTAGSATDSATFLVEAYFTTGD